MPSRKIALKAHLVELNKIYPVTFARMCSVKKVLKTRKNSPRKHLFFSKANQNANDSFSEL